MKGIFIVLEGIDGCGKSTQIKHLSKWLPNSGLMPSGSKLITTREPGGTILGSSIRELLLDNSQNIAPEPTTELLLYAADRAQHISEVIMPAINNGDWVISDRFSSSTLAYQGFGRNLNRDLIYKLEEIATQGIKADLTLLLDISVTESIKRRKDLLKDRIEAEGNLFLERVCSGFASIAKKEDWITISGNQDQKLVGEEIQKKLINSLQKLSFKN
ncbi:MULTISPECIES: dTMP kinase [unclassified Prochlorococcus]|uniref:dTMP kinase n=1 Tax=unclassified Prochlorococcus TaxID=2627481 RepID=UPI000533A86B|nr:MULTISPECIES: dTMP kinase [unclassified Prochlorococcus]KGG16809.1 Thymidylate kinase [Prochlorococcus sp. MIT 0602]KGG18217.1 Thymidylate kinase [Prochlorococcus sp. MIT 0603]